MLQKYDMPRRPAIENRRNGLFSPTKPLFVPFSENCDRLKCTPLRQGRFFLCGKYATFAPSPVRDESKEMKQ
jgi:hypothetical protein